ncbi:MAG: type II toxin-antitoxin system HicB family antitoxin [Chloroflexi bacterium]|nr:type II toxin-antitoxin system HicB family antitoxin [Chloroflexota bacterium]MXX82132.1 type II toxin-antitoxin system HicB family antitoxin [Chloroflexota bacterium]MYA92051.1 type II toxin-antitoxin system HicB family antitoxin [Chloroflexota bacterium]MYC54849.1 type II toxin-antitoxin system HicB family antitoxin [Chloroflexota bacterium]MYE78209.1 type II toxin-antitoxin system HicB family antitoxin [Chloroflexota bacterium]
MTERAHAREQELQMDKRRLQQAKELAKRAYQVHVFSDESTDGDPGYVASVPELPICMSDGSTVEEAKRNLESAKVDFIYFLLEDGLPVPEPRRLDPYVCVDMSDFSAEEGEPAQLPSAHIVELQTA